MSQQTDKLAEEIRTMVENLSNSSNPDDPTAKSIIQGRLALYTKLKEAEVILEPILNAINQINQTQLQILTLLNKESNVIND